MAQPKQEEIVNHPPMDQLPGLEYCIDSNPSWGEAVGLGFQHYILSLGTAVMIPTLLINEMGAPNDDKARVVQTLLFVQGVNTLLQTLFGTRLPTVIGASYAYMVPIMSIIHDPSLARTEDPHERFINTMKAVQGAMIVASSVQIVLGYSQIWAMCSRFFSPLGMVPVIALAGFGLFDRGFPVVGRCVEIGVPMLILFVCLSQYLKHIQLKQLPVLERFALLVSIAVIWTYAEILTGGGAYDHRPAKTQFNCQTDKSHLIASSSWLRVPYPLQWGAPTFNVGHCFGMMAAAIASLIESIGAYKAAARVASATPPPSHVLSRGIGWQGIGVLLSGVFGTLSGSSVSVENIGLIASNRVGSRRVIQISAGFMIFFSVLGKFGALFATIPFPIFAAAYCVLFGLVGSVGLSFLQFTNMNSLRNLFIVGVSFYLGLSIPGYFNEYTTSALRGPAHTRAGWFNDLINTIFSSPSTVAMIVSVLLDNTLDYKTTAGDRGMAWWANFRTFNGDIRSEEFYTLPFNLNRFFPPSP